MVLQDTFLKYAIKKWNVFLPSVQLTTPLVKKSFYYGKMGFADTAEQIVQFFFLEMVKMEIHPWHADKKRSIKRLE